MSNKERLSKYFVSTVEDGIRFLKSLGWTQGPNSLLWKSPYNPVVYRTLPEAFNEELVIIKSDTKRLTRTEAMAKLTDLGWQVSAAHEWHFDGDNVYYTLEEACAEEGYYLEEEEPEQLKLRLDGGLRKWSTGAVRSAKKPDHGDYELLPVFAMQQLAIHMSPTQPTSAVSAHDYPARNWELGIPDSSWFDSTMSHLMKWAQGDGSEDHLRAAMWNIVCMVDQRERIKLGLLPDTLHDMPRPLQGSKYGQTQTRK